MPYQFDFGRIESLEYELARITGLKDRYRHCYIIGTTGTGKTSLMLRMALYDITQGLAVIFIDPKGDHARQLYSLAPNKEKVTYFSYENPSLTINPLRKDGYRIDDLIDEFIEILNILIAKTSPSNPSASENMKEVLGEAIRVLKEEDRNIDFLYDFLRYESTRQGYLQKHYGNKVPLYWQKFDQKNKYGNPSEEAQTAKRLSIRLNKFVQDERLKKVINGPNELDISQLTKNKEIIIVDTSGMSKEKRIYITALFSFAVKSYVEFQKQLVYQPLMFYLDECWMGINESFEYLLKFARSFKVGFTMAHQEVSSFPSVKTLKSIISLSNIKIAMFPAGPDEAKLMAEVYGLQKKDFIELDEYQAWVRIKNKNSLVKAFAPPVVEKMLEPPVLDDERMAENYVTGENKASKDKKIDGADFYFLKECWFPS